MEVLTNQTIYRCSYCGKKNLTKKGSEIHENQYCKSGDSPCRKTIKLTQDNCSHPHIDTVYRYILGEAVQEPDYDICSDCRKVLY